VADRAVHSPASLRRSILVWLVLATAGIGVLALIDTRVEALRTARDVSDRVLVGAAMAIAEGVDADAGGGITISIPFSALDMLSSTAQDQVFYRVDGPAGLLTGYDDLSPAPVATGQEAGTADSLYRGMRVRTVTILRELTTGEGTVPFRVTVTETTRARDALARAILTRSALRIAGLILGAALVAWAAATYALRPLDRLSRAIAARAPSDLTPIGARAPEELRPVLDALNGFLARLAHAMGALQNFASNANHQIRTPLTVARTQLAVAAKPMGPKHQQALDKADTALVRIERVLEQVLLLARIEATGMRPVLKAVDVAALAREVTADLLPQAVRLGKDLGYDGPDSALALCEEVLLGELLRNLVENALTHCPADTMVTVHVSPAEDGAMRISVVDTGPPVTQAQLSQLAGRLDPAEWAGVTRVGPHGLGLQIVAEIAQALQGRLRLDRGPEGRGVAVTLTLAAAAPE
jgi:two-component system sensor histidine kinase TctE